jgi:hypothetical protein
MEQTECSETSAHKIQTPGNYPEENIQHTWGLFTLLLPSLAFFCLLCYAVLCLVPLCNCVLRGLGLCNIVELMCWCVLTICISGSPLLFTYPTSFVISTTLAYFNCIRAFPPCFLGIYKRPLSLGDAARGWLAVSSFSYPAFAVLLGAIIANLKTSP